MEKVKLVFGTRIDGCELEVLQEGGSTAEVGDVSFEEYLEYTDFLQELEQDN